MNEKTQQRLESLFAAGIGFGLSQVANRFIEDLVPEQWGIKDDILRALLRAGTTAVSAVLASVLVRQLAQGRGKPESTISLALTNYPKKGIPSS